MLSVNEGVRETEPSFGFHLRGVNNRGRKLMEVLLSNEFTGYKHFPDAEGLEKQCQ